MLFRSLICLIAVGFATGCFSYDANRFYVLSGVEQKHAYNWTCAANQEISAKKADWATATTVEETIKDEVYQSGLLNLQVGKPYIVRVINEDDKTRTFRAPDLFASSSVLKVIHEGKEIIAPCLEAVAVGPKSASEIHLVPLEVGYYDYHETILKIPHLTEITTNGSVGLAYVY